MLGLVLVLLALSPTIVSGYEGVQCGDFKCSDDPNVVCNSVTNICECKPGFTGNGQVMCIQDIKSICHMQNNASIVAFNGEMVNILMPCQNILTKADIISPVQPMANFLFIRITAIVAPAFNARFPAQVFITGLYIELYVRGDPEQVTMKCNDNGCYDTTNNQQYVNYDDPSKNLTFTVSTNTNNQKVLKVPFYDVEVRFRGEDGSVAITFPEGTLFDLDPGLCNSKSDPVDFNEQLAITFGYSSYDNLVLFLNQVNIPGPSFEPNVTCQKMRVGCFPSIMQHTSINVCSVFYTDRSFSECFYNYRNKNDSQILVDFDGCRQNVCNAIAKPAICTIIGDSGCKLSRDFATGSSCP